MSQINVNPSGSESDRSGAATINMVTVIIVLAVLIVDGWFLFTGPLASLGAGGRDTNINVNVPKVEQPAQQPPAQQPPAKTP
jgi:hypothetical protein